MRGGRSLVGALGLSLAACAAQPTPPSDGKLSVRPEERPRPVPAPEYRLPDPEPKPPADPAPGGGGFKGPGAGAVQVKAEVPPKAEPTIEDVLRIQKELAARNPSSDDEKIRLALLHATRGSYEEAEKILSTVRTRTNKLVPYFDFFLRRQLGDHREASKLLAQFDEEERLVTGFVIERAELVSRVRRFRDFTPAENDKVAPGGQVHIYLEARNFRLQKLQDKHVLHLRYEWKLFDDRSAEHPVPAWGQAKPEDREDRISTSGPFTEFYQSFRLPLPVNLAMGQYRVQITVTDVVSGKHDRAFVPIYVVAVERPR
jgi:hypothetical protein